MARENGFEVAICYVAIHDVETAVERIAKRVKEGGHFICREDVARRFKRSLSLFFNVYADLVDSWYFFDNSDKSALLVANRENGNGVIIYDKLRHEKFRSEA